MKEEEEEEARQKMKEEEEAKKKSGSNGGDDDDDPNLISRQWKDGVLFEVGIDYEIIELIHHRLYYSKCSARKRLSGEEVVIQKIQDPFLYNRFKQFLGDYCRFIPVRILREILVCKLLQFHPLFLELKDVVIPHGRESENNRWSLQDFNDVYLIYDPVDSTLDQLIKSKKELRFELEYIFAELMIGLDYLKKLKIIHRNLDPMKLLVNKDLHLKISDFGNSSSIRKPEKTMLPTVPTGIYSAPELILGCRNYDHSVDMWSSGCILGAILNRSDLFLDDSEKVARYVLEAKLQGRDISPAATSEKTQQLWDIFWLVGVPSEEDLHFIDNEEDRILVKTIIDDIKVELGDERASKSQISACFPNATKPAIDLIERMLAFNPNKRIKVEDALQHEYIAKNVEFWKETNEGRIHDPTTDDMWDDMDEKERLSELTSVKHLWSDLTNKELCDDMFDDIKDDRKLRDLILTEMQRFHPSVHE